MIFQAFKSSSTAPQNLGHAWSSFKENQGRRGFITKTFFSHVERQRYYLSDELRQLSASQEFGFAGNFESLLPENQAKQAKSTIAA